MQHARTVLLLALLSAAAWAAPVGAIKGYLRDSTGAIIPNATVTLTNEDTGVSRKL